MIMGQVLQAGAGQAPARQAAVGAGLPKEMPADTVNKVCASSIRALEIADLMIRAGDTSSSSPAAWSRCRTRRTCCRRRASAIGSATASSSTRWSSTGSRRPSTGMHMVQQASIVSRELGISREEQDEWAARSHQRAAAAQDAGRFDDEIVAVGELAADEGVRRDTSLEKLAALKPVFDPDGTTTAGNAPGVNDGASCVIVCSRGVRASGAASSRSRRSSRRATSPTISPISRGRPRRRARRRSRRRARRSTTSRASRSTRRSRRSR